MDLQIIIKDETGHEVAYSFIGQDKIKDIGKTNDLIQGIYDEFNKRIIIFK